jgi:hypothetical protein
MIQSYVSQFKFSIFHFRSNWFNNLNMFQYQIVLCIKVHFIMGSLTIFQMLYFSNFLCLTMLCYYVRLQWVIFWFVKIVMWFNLRVCFVLVCIVYICFNILFSSHNLGWLKVMCEQWPLQINHTIDVFRKSKTKCPILVNYFIKTITSNEGFWKTPVSRFFNSKNFPKTKIRGSSISKNWK